MLPRSNMQERPVYIGLIKHAKLSAKLTRFADKMTKKAIGIAFLSRLTGVEVVKI
jgi:hypothetical protein